MKSGEKVPDAEQYSTNNLVTALPRNISVYIPHIIVQLYLCDGAQRRHCTVQC